MLFRKFRKLWQPKRAKQNVQPTSNLNVKYNMAAMAAKRKHVNGAGAHARM